MTKLVAVDSKKAAQKTVLTILGAKDEIRKEDVQKFIQWKIEGFRVIYIQQSKIKVNKQFGRNMYHNVNRNSKLLQKEEEKMNSGKVKKLEYNKR